MAISKEQKQELVELYKSWLTESDAMVVARYHGLSVKDISDLRAEIRASKGEFHIVKNTLAKIAFKEMDWEWDEQYFTGPTALGVSFGNPPGLAKAIKDFLKESESIEIKGGYLEGKMMTAAEIKALADLPTMPEMRAKLLQTIMAPASQLTRILAEPGRQLAAVLKAYSSETPAGEAV